MNAIIVDDENKACTNLEKMLKTYAGPGINIMGIANSTAEAEILINKYNPDVVFLDIEMPDENAFEFLERISPISFEIVFATAYDEFAVKAFRLNAIDYILKPLRLNDLKNAVGKIKDRLQYKSLMQRQDISYTSLYNQVSNTTGEQSITLRDLDGIEVLNFKDIYYVEAHGSYSKFVFLKDGEMRETLSSYPLSYYEELLPVNTFYRIHRSYILNCQHIKNITTDCSQVTVSNNTTLPVSRRRFQGMLGFLKK